MNRDTAGGEIRVGRQTVHLTPPQKRLFPEDDIDKRQLAEYCEQIAGVMLPHVRDRPVAMKRFPDRNSGRPPRSEKVHARTSRPGFRPPRWKSKMAR
jgi:DNA primase